MAASLVNALQGIVPDRVPPPVVCDHVNKLPMFFNADLLTMRKQGNESLRCFRIRLENVAAAVETHDTGRTALMMTCLRNNVSGDILYQVDLKLCSKSDVTIEEFISTCEAVSGMMQRGHSVSNPNTVASGRAVREIAIVEEQQNDRNSEIRCYKCGVLGHYASQCGDKKTCYTCGKSGHISRTCPDKRTKSVSKNELKPEIVC